MNWCWHRYGKWRIANEVPVWKDRSNPRYAICERPKEMRTFEERGTGKRFQMPGEDYDYILVGKLIEQTRQCGRCGFVQSKFRKMTV